MISPKSKLKNDLRFVSGRTGFGFGRGESSAFNGAGVGGATRSANKLKGRVGGAGVKNGGGEVVKLARALNVGFAGAAGVGFPNMPARPEPNV
jgi:hypothetical protein